LGLAPAERLGANDIELLVGLLNTGRSDEAERRATELVRARPADGMLWKILSVSLMRQNKDALPALRRAAELLPQDVEARANLVDELLHVAGSLRDAGQRPEALAAFQEAVDLDPTRADTHFHIGRVLLELRRPRRAADSFQAAISRQPNQVAAHLGLASAQRVQGHASEAEVHCERALAIAPESRQALILSGELRADRGQFEQAQELFERVRTSHPNFVPAYCSIAAHRRMTQDDGPWLQGVHSLLKTRLSLVDEVELRHALGKYFDEVGAYDEAFSSYQQSKELTKRFGGAYDETHLTALVERIIQRCDGSPVPGASDSEEPVFIIGMPRSGTSLAEQILASHPAVAAAGEVIFWERGFERVATGRPAPQGSPAARGVSASFGSAASAGDSAPHEILAQEYLQRVHERAGAALPTAAPRTTAEPRATTIAPRTTVLRTTDKMPANFLYAGLIHSVFPRARIIHMQRHPLDTCLSIYFQSFFNVTGYANDLNHLAHYYGQYLRIMAHWRNVLPSQAMLEVPYEELVRDPEAWIRRMVDFIGLPWDPQCLQFQQAQRAVITASRWQVRQKINAGSVGRWRHYAKYLTPLRHLAPGA